ncbi:MAG: response regulator [Rhodobacterales bacterium]|nr:response regulator [Rhodobacterales bacterium]
MAGFRGRVLVVDDHKQTRMKMMLAIKNLGHDVEEAADGEAGIARLARGGIDMVVLDIVMPGMDGFEVLKAMKANSALRDIPAIVISSLEEMDDVVKAIELGAEDFLTKSFDVVLLRARLNAGLERKRLRDQELEYLRQVDRLAGASRMVEGKGFDPARLGLEDISRRDDALGNLSRVFVTMASEVYRREQNLRRTISLLKGGFLLLLIGALWGLIPSISRIVMREGLSPFGIVFWTLWFSAAIMTLLSIITGQFPGRSRADLLRYALIGLIGGTLPQLTLFWVAGHLPAMIISIILAVESFLVFAFAALLGLEAPSMKRFIGLSLGLVCVLLVILPGEHAIGGASWIWILVALLVPIFYAVEGLMIASLPATETGAIGTTTGIVLASALIATPVALLSGSFIPVHEVINGLGWAFLLIAAMSATSMVLSIIAIRTTGAVFTSQVGYATTGAGIIWSILLLDEQMTGWIVAAVACLISGVALVMPKSYDEEGDDPSPEGSAGAATV